MIKVLFVSLLLALLSISFVQAEGTWGEWTSFGNCSLNCGGVCGKQERTRVCNGEGCSGDAEETQECGNQIICLFPHSVCCPGYMKSYDTNTRTIICTKA